MDVFDTSDAKGGPVRQLREGVLATVVETQLDEGFVKGRLAKGGWVILCFTEDGRVRAKLVTGA